jgi:hypothetical protein
VPVLRKEFAALRPAHVPDGPVRPADLPAAGSTEGTTAVSA